MKRFAAGTGGRWTVSESGWGAQNVASACWLNSISKDLAIIGGIIFLLA